MIEHRIDLSRYIALIVPIAAKGAFAPVTAAGKLIGELGVHILLKRKIGKIRKRDVFHSRYFSLRIYHQFSRFIKRNETRDIL